MCARRKPSDKKRILISDEFYSDLSEKDMIHAVLVRSPFSYGKITSIAFSAKAKIPEGYELFTFKDVGESCSVEILGMQIPLLCSGEIAYKGEPIAILAGEDTEILEELKSAVKITLDKNEVKENESKFSKMYNSLPLSLKEGGVTTLPIEQSITSLRNTLAHFSKPREIIAKRKIQIGNVEEIFDDSEKAAFIVSGNWSNQAQFHANKETEGCLAQVKGGNLHIFTPTNWISQSLETISEVTRFPKEKIFITRTKLSTEDSNSLFMNGILASLASLVAIKTGKPVKLSLSREEQEQFIERAAQIKISHKTALDKNGIITAMEIAIDYDAGAFNPLAPYTLDRLALAATGIYTCKNVKVSAKAYKSHNPPLSIPMSMIDASAFFAVENQIQKAAEVTGVSPIDLRQMNKAGSLQKMTKPFLFSFGRSSDAINAVAIRGDFKRKYAVARLAQHGRLESALSFSSPLRGIGLACAFSGSGFLGSDFEKASISMHISVTEEKKIVVHAIPPSLAVKEIWSKLILESIEIEKRNIVFTSELNDENLKKASAIRIPSKFAGEVSIKTMLLKKCLDSLKRKKIDGTPLSIKKTLPTSRKKAWSQEEFSGAPFYNTAFGTCTVEVELDQCSFREKLRKICVIIDGGRILNPKAAENAVHRAIQHCLSSLVEGDSLSCPVITVQFTQSEEEPKQIGALVYSMLPAAYTMALSQAVAKQVESLPLQTDSLFTLFETYEDEAKTAIEDEK